MPRLTGDRHIGRGSVSTDGASDRELRSSGLLGHRRPFGLNDSAESAGPNPRDPEL